MFMLTMVLMNTLICYPYANNLLGTHRVNYYYYNNCYCIN